MKLYLVQHAKAVSQEENPERPLSEEGKQELNKVAEFVRPLEINVDYLWHSAKLRAVQTGEILAEVVKVNKGRKQREGLNPNDEVGKLQKELAVVEGDVMIVGHLPFLGKLASLLLSGNESANTVALRNAGIVCLTYGKDAGWQLEWAATPALLV